MSERNDTPFAAEPQPAECCAVEPSPVYTKDFEHAPLLPDSRARDTKNVQFRGGVPWVPIFCANCGCDGGLVPEENMTFVFWLCNKCFETHGALTNMHVMPDEVFWEQIKQEQLEKFDRFLTDQELLDIVAADASPLATLIKSGRQHGA